jgi:broad specificity phosphatase PhoE
LRITSWLSTIDDSNDNTLIVAHGAALRSVVGILDEIPRDVIGRAVLKNCEMIQRDIAPGTWSKLHQQLLSED